MLRHCNDLSKLLLILFFAFLTPQFIFAESTILIVQPSTITSKPGSGFRITYRWNAEPMQKDYSVFVHFVDKDGKMVLQDDHLPPTPTSKWNGQIEYTRMIILDKWKPDGNKTLDIGLPEGEYTIHAGLYNKEDNSRAPLKAGQYVKASGDYRFAIGTLRSDPDASHPEIGEKSLDLSNYEITFVEEFIDLRVSAWGPIEPDGARWIAHTPWHGDFGDARFADPQEDFPFTINDGILRIEARKKDGRWQSGLLSAVDADGNGFKQKYGYFECRAKLPEGPGTWPAFWLVGLKNLKKVYGESGPRQNPEIDIVEHYGHWPTRLSFAFHLWGFEGMESTHEEERLVAFGMEEDFHTYGAMVTKDEIIVYFDGIELFRRKSHEAVNTPLYPLVNLALGPGWPLDQTPNPCYMYVDYIKIWKKK